MVKPTTPQLSVSEAVNRALVEDHARIRAILEAPEAQHNMATAIKLALTHRMDAPSAIDILTGLPKSAKSDFAAMMKEYGAVDIASPLGGKVGASDPKETRKKEIAETGIRNSLAKGYITEAQAKTKLAKLGVEL